MLPRGGPGGRFIRYEPPGSRDPELENEPENVRPPELDISGGLPSPSTRGNPQRITIILLIDWNVGEAGWLPDELRTGKPALASDLAGAENLILAGGQLGEGEWPAAVKFLGADAHFRSEAESPAVGETGRSIPIHRGRIHVAKKFAGIAFIPGNNGIRMPRGMTIDVSDGRFGIGNDFDRHAETKIFFVPILRLCRRDSRR